MSTDTLLLFLFIQKLFQRFVQRGGAPGTGLGLAIAKHLVSLAGGTIGFESDPAIKPGTNCIVRLPLTVCDSRDGSNIEGDVDTSMIDQHVRWLIVDDSKMNRLMLKRRIQTKICTDSSVKEASSGEEALEICKSETFDVIVVDQYMEEAGGVLLGTDCVFAMRRAGLKAVIIGCSGNDLEQEFCEAGADWIWQKPMPSNAEVISSLRAALTDCEKNLV